MKKLGLLILLLIIAVSFSGCLSELLNRTNPDERAESYFDHSEIYCQTPKKLEDVTKEKFLAFDEIFGTYAGVNPIKLYERDHLGIGIGADTAFLEELQRIYNKEGFFPKKTFGKVFDIKKDTGTISHNRAIYHLNYDHIAVELRFMHVLAEKGKGSDQKNFFNSHLKNWLIGTPSFTEKCEQFYIEEERKKGELDEWQTYYRENIQLLKKFIESESIRFENMDSPAGANSINLYTQLSSSTISSTDVDSEVISMNHGNYIERTADSNYQVTNLEVPENLQFLSVSVISTDVNTGFELQLWDPHGRLRGARDATAGKATIMIPKTDEINIYGGTWEIAIWKKIKSDFNYIISTGEIFSVYTIPLSPIKDTDFNFHLIGENPDWLEMNSISGTIELTLPDGIIGESKKTVQIASGEIKDIVFSLHANEIGKHTITVTAKSMGYPYFQYVDIDIIEEEKEFTPLDLCMVLDRSGSMDESMGGKTRMQGVKEAAKGVVNVLLPQDRVSIVSFSDTATANIDLTSDFNAVKTKINAINAGGGTSFGAGLDTALDQFKAHGNSDHNPAILFMSDGEHNRAPDPEAYVTQCKNKGIPIFTVGFATSESEVDVTILKMMSEETGGEYHFVSKNFNLQNIFLRLQHKASGWESVAVYVGEVDEGETVTAGTFYVDPAIDDLRVTLNWPGSNLDLELFDPSSRQVDFSASNVIYSGDTKPEYVIIKDPQSGTWTTKVYGKSIGSSEEYYVLVTKYEPPMGSPVHNLNTGEDFATIQNAIDDPDTQAGNTITVDPGTYTEHLAIDKPLKLMGDDKNTTIIEGRRSEKCVIVTADNVEISGFTIQNSTYGIWLESSDGCTISRNIIQDNCDGIYLTDSNNNAITNNILFNNVLYLSGIHLSSSHNNEIRDNDLVENGRGVSLHDSNNNLIYHNNFVDGIFRQAYDNTGTNSWDNGPTAGGNYWSDHGCIGNPSAKPYYIDNDGVDHYPFQESDGWLKGNQPPVNPTLSPDKPEPQSAGTAVTWTASATDPDGDPLYYLFRLKGPATGNSWQIMRDWSTDNTWTWYTSSPGGDTDVSGWSKLDIAVWIRDGHHAPSDRYDLEKIYFDYYIYKFIG